MRKSFLVLEIILVVIVGIITYSLYKQYFKRPTVSVIISTYNMVNTLPKAIDSILNQTFPDFELIVVNDGSTDGTDSILLQYLKKDQRVRVITNEKNLGLIASLNKGLKKARGKYIARLDADDTSYPDRLERQVAFMKKHDLDFSSAKFDTIKEKWNSERPLAEDELDSDFLGFRLFFRNIFVHSAAIFRKDFLEQKKLRYNPKRPHAEDYALWLQIFLNGGKLGIMGGRPVTTYKYSGHNKIWWTISDNSVKITKKEALKKIIPDFPSKKFNLSPGEVSCDLLRLMVEGNEKTKILNQEKLIEFEEKSCR